MNDKQKKTRKSQGSKKLSRRNFIAASTTAAAVGGLSSISRARDDDFKSKTFLPPRIRWRLRAQREEQAFLDGSTAPFFRFKSIGNTRSNGNLPLLRARENRLVSVSIENTVDFPIQPTIVGFESGPVIMPQETGVWRFNMPPAGTWIFTESLLGPIASSAGFAAAMVSTPTIAAEKMQEYFLLYQDADDRWNLAIDEGNVPDQTVFEPNYHTLNGLTYPNTLTDADTRVSVTLGEDALIRIANVSNIPHSIHFHGFHANLIRRNNIPENIFPEKDTFAIPANSTAEIIMPVIQVGEYPLHPHALTSTTDNGTYQAGSVTMIDAQA